MVVGDSKLENERLKAHVAGCCELLFVNAPFKGEVILEKDS